MDHERLDRLSRLLAAPSVLSRRSALTMLGTAMLGMLVGADAESTHARPKSRHHTSRKTRQHSKPKTGHHDKPHDPDGQARLLTAKRKKHGRKRGQRHGQRDQRGGATTPRPDGAAGGASGGSGCTSQPKSLTCAGVCGMKSDNCGREVDCGQCRGPDGPTCVSPPLSATCNGKCDQVVVDICGRQVDCGTTCSGFETCGGGGVSYLCGCTPEDWQVTCTGRCGVVVDNCGGEFYCGSCNCLSQDRATTCSGKCRTVVDNCNRLVDCGNTCPGAETCGGGGVYNSCGCTSQSPSLTCAGKCGVVTDNCGRDVSCGNTCSGFETCSGGGTSNTCGCTSQSTLVTCRGRCGKEIDNCGREVECGTCPHGGCFIAGTQVTMADGSGKPIELIEPGDRVLGRGGRVNRVRGVLRPTLGDRKLYALNGGTAFVTASHPFLTTDGWKAVDPEAARAEVPGLDIERLSVGDLLQSVTSSAPVGDAAGPITEERGTNVDQREIALRSLEGRSADATTQLYNLDVDGDDSYVANGLVVHNKLF